MKRSGPIARRTPLERRRRAFIVSAFHAAATAPRRRSKTPAGEFPPRVRRLVYARFEGRCALDGDWINPADLVIQHRRARGAGGSRDPITSSPPNGVALHPLCHEHIEAHPAEALRDGFRVRQGQHPRDWPIRLWTGQWVLLTDDGGWRPV